MLVSVRFALVTAALLAVPALADPASSLAPRRDPFTAYTIDGFQPACTKAPGVLCAELDSVSLVGVVTGVPSPRALFEDKDGRSHVLKVGDVVGRHRITALRRGQVVLRQQLGPRAEVVVGLVR